jgi:hypothetical protein
MYGSMVIDNKHSGGLMSDTMTVKTNRQVRELHAWYELPPAIAAKWFDYVDEDERYSPRFVKYRGDWHDVNEFEYLDDMRKGLFPGTWDGYQSDSFFSGLLVRYTDSQCENVIIGRYYS